MGVQGPCGCPDGIATCGEVMECVTPYFTCPGGPIYYDEARECFLIKLGTCLAMGPGGEIVWTCGDEPDPGPCEMTVDRAFADFAIGGRGGGAANLVAYGGPEAIGFALSNHIVLIENHAFGLVDGIAAWGIGNKGSAINSYTMDDFDVSQPNARASNEWEAFRVDAGNANTPTNRSALAPDAEKKTDGGWFGYGARSFGLMTVDAALSHIAGRAVALLDTSQGVNAGKRLPTSDLDVTACIDAVNRACAWKSVIITVTPDDMAAHCASINNANLASCVGVNDRTDVKPTDVAAAGARFVRIDGSLPDSYIQSFVDAGLDVIVRTNSRQVETARAHKLGAKALVCNDPVYARGQFPTYPTVTFYGRKTQMGCLDVWSDQGGIVSAMGYSRDAETGRWIYNASWIADRSLTDGSQIQNLLLGSLAAPDGQDASAYTLKFRMKIEFNNQPSTTSARAGVFFGCDSDVDFSGAAPDKGALYDYSKRRNGYFAYMHVGTSNEGRLKISKFTNGSWSDVASTGANVNYPKGTWMDFTVTVTATSIRFARDGANSVTVDDVEHRGRFFGVGTWNSTSTPGTWQTGFYNVFLTWADQPVMSEASTLRALVEGGDAEPDPLEPAGDQSLIDT